MNNLPLEILQLLQPSGNGVTFLSKSLQENGLGIDISSHDFVPLQHIRQTQPFLWSQIQQQSIQTTNNYNNSIFLEIIGKSQLGKTELLMQCMAHAICPQIQKLAKPSPNWRDYIIETNYENSNSHQIFYFDCQHKWNAFRFLQILESKIAHLLQTIYCLSNQTNESVDMDQVLIWMSANTTQSTEITEQIKHGKANFDTLLTNCLGRVKLFKPNSLMECWITLEALYWQSIQSIQQKQTFSCQLFCMDGMNSWYEMSQFDKTQQIEWKHLCSAILKFCKVDVNCMTLITKVPVSKTNLEADFMPREWIDQVTHRLFLTKYKGKTTTTTHHVKQAMLKFYIPHTWIASTNSSWYTLKQQMQDSFTKVFTYRIGEQGIAWQQC